MNDARDREHFDTLVIGGGQAGLAAGYHLARRGLDFVILDASERVGDVWRSRWDSLRLFTPAAYDGLPGMPFPSPGHYFPTKDEFADFLEGYAEHFRLPVRSGVRVDELTRRGDVFLVGTGDRRYEADNVIVALGSYQEPKEPDFAAALHPSLTTLHSFDYRAPSQLQPGPTLLVGAGNSGAEIAVELARERRVILAGRDTGELPFRPRSTAARFLWLPLVLRIVFRKVLSIRTPIGRARRPALVGRGGPLIRVKKRDLAAAGVERVGRVTGVREGMPVVDDGRVLDEVRNVIFCTGFETGFESWIRLPVHGGVHDHEPRHQGGIVSDQPGLYFLGLHFLRSLASGMIQGVGDDAAFVVDHLARRQGRGPGGGARVGARGMAGRPAA